MQLASDSFAFLFLSGDEATTEIFQSLFRTLPLRDVDHKAEHPSGGAVFTHHTDEVLNPADDG